MRKSNFYRTQIKGLTEVAETVRVIEKSAASRIHLLRKEVFSLREYRQSLDVVLRRLTLFYPDKQHPLLRRREFGEEVLLLITGEKGIVGGLYHELISRVAAESQNYGQIWVMGSKGEEYLREEGIRAQPIFTLADLSVLPKDKEIGHRKKDLLPPSGIFGLGSQLSRELFRRFRKEHLKRVRVLYAGFVSLARQRPKEVTLLPFNFAMTTQQEINQPAGLAQGLPLFEPGKKVVLDELLQRYQAVFLTQILLEAKLAEFAARTVTAESAVRETKRIRNTLRRRFLKIRRSNITQRQVESFSVHQFTQRWRK